HKQRPHPPVFGMDGLDGYLTALIIGPRFIDPRQWIPLFAGEQALIALKARPRRSPFRRWLPTTIASRPGLVKRWKPGARALRGAMTVPSIPSTGRLPSCSLPAMPQGSGAPFPAVMPQPATSSPRSGTQRG
ncbi:MAG: UPF0149 family protein, partial [Mesorhizobium sp.]